MHRIRINKRPQTSPDQLISKQEIADKLKISTRTLMRWVRQDEFPLPIQISTTTIRWRLIDFENWLQEQQLKQAS